MRVFAITQRIAAPQRHGKPIRKRFRLIGEGEPARDHGVIFCGRRISLGRAEAAKVIACRAVLLIQLGHETGIVGRIGQYGHAGMVLGGGSHHGRTANIDILNDLVSQRALGDRLCEGVKVDHDEIDRANSVFVHSGAMRVVIAYGEEAAMHLGMERLHPPVHHLGKAGQFRNVDDGQACVAQGLGGAAGGHQLDVASRKRRSKFGKSRLVGHREERPFHRHVIHATILT